jgi:hypothetical protein
VDPEVAVLFGAAISGIVALGAQFLGGWITAYTARRERRNERLGRFLRGSYDYLLAIGEVARATHDEKAGIERDRVSKYVEVINGALSEIDLNDPPDLVTAAHAHDLSLGMLIGSARGAVYDRQDWREERGRIVDDTLSEFRAVARRHVGRSRRRLALDAVD